MFYTIYKITNKINSKYYIGKHRTKDLDDGYMGSGKLLKRAIEKYGIENFTKEIIFVFDNEYEMNNKEKELVVISEKTYNLCEGGRGGFSYINSVYWTKEKRALRNKRISPFGKNIKIHQMGGKARARIHPNLSREIAIENHKKKILGFYGRQHSLASREKMKGKRKNSTGERNSQYGTMWITNGSQNKKIKSDAKIPEKWYKGRVTH